MKKLVVFSIVIIFTLAIFIYSSEIEESPNLQNHKNHLLESEIKVPVDPLYELPLQVFVSGKVINDGLLSVKISGKGKCELLLSGAFSEQGKDMIHFEKEDSILKVDLETFSSPREFMIILPDKDGNYDKTINYSIPKPYQGIYSKIEIECLIYPFIMQDAKLYRAINYDQQPQ
jgi:hypothetical protein